MQTGFKRTIRSTSAGSAGSSVSYSGSGGSGIFSFSSGQLGSLGAHASVFGGGGTFASTSSSASSTSASASVITGTVDAGDGEGDEMADYQSGDIEVVLAAAVEVTSEEEQCAICKFSQEMHNDIVLFSKVTFRYV